MNLLKPDTTLLQSRLDEAFILLNARTGRYFQLNPVASRVWELLATPTGAESLAEKIASEYDVSVDAAGRDIADLLRGFEQDGLLVPADEPSLPVIATGTRADPPADPRLKVAGVLAGVGVSSNWKLPDLSPAGGGDCSVAIYFLSAEQANRETPEMGEACAFPAVLEVEGRIDCNGSRIIIVEQPGMRDDPLLWVRRVLPFAAALQGAVILHASAVAIGSGVHAFIGASTAGKSTLAARLAALGLGQISDDLLSCLALDNQVLVPHPTSPQRLPMRSLNFLSRHKAQAQVTRIPLSRAEAMHRLLVNGFGEMDLPAIWAAQFRCYDHIANAVPAFDLCLPDDLTRLDESVGRVGALLGRPAQQTPLTSGN